MRNLFLFFLSVLCINATAKNSEVARVLTQVFNDSTIHKYLSNYGGIDSLGYAIIENHGDYYIYNGDIKNKESALAKPYIGKIKKMKISSNRAKVRIHITNNNFNITAKLYRTDDSQPWLINSRLISNLFQFSSKRERLFHFSNS